MDSLQISMGVIVTLVIVALLFDFMNGFHDAANSIATVVSTGVLKPGQAVVFAAFFNFAAYFTFGLKVAETVGKGIIDKDVVTPHVIFGALVVVNSVIALVAGPWMAAVPLVLNKPNLPASPASAWTSWRDEFDGALSDEWIGLRTPGQTSQFAIAEGELRMIAGPAMKQKLSAVSTPRMARKVR